MLISTYQQSQAGMPDTAHTPTALEIRNACLCLAAQRAARMLARRFDRAFARLGITNNQFSLMMMLSGPKAPLMTRLATALAMDRTTLTAALKALERRGLIEVRADERDRRGRRASLTPQGRATLQAAVPIWQAEHAALEAAHDDIDPGALRAMLGSIASH